MFLAVYLPSHEQPRFIFQARAYALSLIRRDSEELPDNLPVEIEKLLPLQRSSSQQSVTSFQKHLLIYLSYFLIVWGVVACICGTTIAILSSEEDSDC